MSGHSEESIKNHVKVYIRVFLALAVLTVVTVGVSYLHLPIWPAVILALIIACFKGSLVAAFFMHLSTEKKIIIALLLLTIPLFFFLLIVPSISHW